jgi:hypothetical protein
VDAEICLLLLVDKDGELRVRSSRGIDQDLADAFVGHMEEDVIRRLHQLLALGPHYTLASVPIIAKHSLNGMIVVARETPLEQQEEWQLSALADQAAIALWNARLYEMTWVRQIRNEIKPLPHWSLPKPHPSLGSIQISSTRWIGVEVYRCKQANRTAL